MRVNPCAYVSDPTKTICLYYLSYADTDKVKLSEEHKDFLWADRKQIIELIDKPILDDLTSNTILDMLDIE